MKELTKVRAGYLLILVCIGFLIFVLVKRANKNPPIRIDPETMCPKKGVNAVEFLLLDISDQIYQSQIEFLYELVEERVASLGKYEKLSVFLIDPIEYRNPEPVFNQCNPGTGEDVSNIDDNRELRRKRFETFFQEKLFSKLKEVNFDGTLQTSPIMEMIKVVVQKPKFKGLKTLRINLFSDMLQNMPPRFSQYGQRNTKFQEFFNTDYARNVIPNELDGRDVAVYYLVRRKPHQYQSQGQDHVEFWHDYFHHTNSNIIAFQKVL